MRTGPTRYVWGCVLPCRHVYLAFRMIVVITGLFFPAAVLYMKEPLYLLKLRALQDTPGDGDAIVDLVVQNIRLGGICRNFRQLFYRPEPERPETVTWHFPLPSIASPLLSAAPSTACQGCFDCASCLALCLRGFT